MDKARWPELRERLAAIFATRSRDEWCELMEGTDVCFAPVLAMSEALEHPHVRDRGTFTEVAGVTQPAPAPRFSRTPGSIQRPPSHVGQHTDEVLGEWLGVDAEQIAPVMFRSAMAAEDANFCLHWGFDVDAIQAAIEAGGARGASTISQQVVKNVFLWQDRSWVRKGMEAVLTPVSEAMWSKRRILELYLNVAEFDEGVFGVQAAAQHYFGVDAADLSPLQAARLAAVLPSPKTRSASNPSNFVDRRARSIRGGAETINQDGRAACFQN